MVQGAAAHVGQRRNFDVLFLEQLGHFFETHQVVQRIVKRAQVGIDLLRQIAGQEAEPLAGLDRRPGEDDAADLVALEGVDGGGDREIGLAGAGRADAEGDVVFLDVAQILCLVRRAAMQVGLFRQQSGTRRRVGA